MASNLARKTAPHTTRTAGSNKRAPRTNAGEQPQNTADLLAYIADLTEELEQLSASINEPTLSYLLSMARAEAELIAARRRGG